MNKFQFFAHVRYSKTLIGQQFRPILDLLCKEDLNVELPCTINLMLDSLLSYSVYYCSGRRCLMQEVILIYEKAKVICI